LGLTRCGHSTAQQSTVQLNTSPPALSPLPTDCTLNCWINLSQATSYWSGPIASRTYARSSFSVVLMMANRSVAARRARGLVSCTTLVNAHAPRAYYWRCSPALLSSVSLLFLSCHSRTGWPWAMGSTPPAHMGISSHGHTWAHMGIRGRLSCPAARDQPVARNHIQEQYLGRGAEQGPVPRRRKRRYSAGEGDLLLFRCCLLCAAGGSFRRLEVFREGLGDLHCVAFRPCGEEHETRMRACLLTMPMPGQATARGHR
jgi:hypothetical protein